MNDYLYINNSKDMNENTQKINQIFEALRLRENTNAMETGVYMITGEARTLLINELVRLLTIPQA